MESLRLPTRLHMNPRAPMTWALTFVCLIPVLTLSGQGAQTSNSFGPAVRSVPACEVKVVSFATGLKSGQTVTPQLPAHVGDILSASYLCVPFNAPPARTFRPAPRAPVTVTVGDAMAQIVNDDMPERFQGSEQLTFVVPAPLTGTTAPDTTVWESSLQLAIGIRATAPQPLPIVYEPNGSYLGSMSAPVTMVEYGDYQCPFCELFYRNTWPALKSEYVDTGKVRFLFQDMAFLGPDSTSAAEGAHCAGEQYRFWEYHDYLYAHQGAENSGWAAIAQLNQFASDLGLDTTRFSVCLNSAEYLQEVKNETAGGYRQKIDATPGFLINGTIVMGAQPLSTFEQAINSALQH